MKKKHAERINNLIVISDAHCGCRLGLCSDEPVRFDDGGTYQPSALQRKIWLWWLEFWHEWVPMVTHGEPYAAVFNGDMLDGNHHNSTTQISHNEEDQIRVLELALKPVWNKKLVRLYWVRGTEAHVGKSARAEERIARQFGAKPNAEGQFARYDLRIQLGRGLVHLSHHIGTTGTSAYESTAPMKELVEAYVEAGRNRLTPPDVVVRSHRHRYIELRVPTLLGYGISLTTPAWQLKTPYVYRSITGRVALPQIGGVLVRQGDNDVYTRSFVRSIEPEQPEVLDIL